MSTGGDFRRRQWRSMDEGSRRHARWIYRTMRRDGIDRTTARMYFGGAMNAGFLSGINDAMRQP